MNEYDFEKDDNKICWRPLVCFLVVLAVVFGYCGEAFAAFYEGWGGILYQDYDMTAEEAANYSYPDINTITSFASANSLAYDFNFTGSRNIYQGVSGLQFSTLENPTTYYVAGGSNFSVADLPIVVTFKPYGSHLVWHRVSGSGKLAVFNNYIVSDQAFTVYSIYNRSGFNDAWQLSQFCKTTEANTANEYGYYAFDLDSFYIDGIVNQNGFRLAFTDLYINLTTTSGDSGSTGWADYTIGSDNVDYNYLIESDMIPDPQAPLPANPVGNLIEQNTYANLTAYVSGQDAVSLMCDMNFRLPTYVRHNANYYKVRAEYAVYVSTTNSSALARVYNWEHDIPMTSITGYGVSNNYDDADSYTDIISFNDLEDSTGATLKERLREYWSTETGASQEYYNDNSVISYGVRHVSGSRSFGGYKLGEGFSIDSMYCVANLYIVSTEGNNSGSYSCKFDMLEGTQEILQNEIGVRDVDGTPTYFPVEGGSGGTNVGNGGIYIREGDVTVRVEGQGQFEPYIMDPGDYANMKDLVDTLKDEYDEENENGFLMVVGRFYSILPEGIWRILYIGIGLVTFTAVVRFVRNRR